jgi:GH25 family lysozyme M1 (1,4-beta-N-acetylmuramidase)
MAKNKRRQKKKRILNLKILVFLAIFLIGGVYYMQRADSIHVESGDQVQVIDVSFWNGKIQWNKVKKEGIYYAMLRIGRGENSDHKKKEDEYFAKNYRSGKSYHIKMGVYFYSYATTIEDAKKEAEYCLELLHKYGIDPNELKMPVAYDVEEASIFKTGRNNVTDMTQVFCETIKEAGYTPMIYSSASSLIKYFKHSTIKNYKIWVAHYGVEDSGPSYPYHYDMWQYTSNGIVPGANTSGEDKKGDCDINYYVIE